LKHFAEELDIDSFISFNGSYVVYKGKSIFEKSISMSTIEALERCASEKGRPLVYLGNEQCYANLEQHPDVIESFHSLRVRAPEYRSNYYKETKIYQVLLYCQADEENYYMDQFSDLSFVRWHLLSTDIIPAGGSKAVGIHAMLQFLKLTPSNAVAFGDGLNDKEMLDFVGMGIAMGNAHEEVKSIANFTTKHVNDGGIRHGLQMMKLI
jgi:Cof subfamily protein (haloacid dehalogenase superfamily)